MRRRAWVALGLGERDHQEDAALCMRGLRPLYMVCDGMGGQSSGSFASEGICRHMRQRFPAQPPDQPTPAALLEAMTQCHFALFDELRQRGMMGQGTTCTALSISEAQAHIAHIGDSRAYLLRGDALTQLTQDHTLYEEWTRSGQDLSASNIPIEALHNILMRSLLFEAEPPDIALYSVPLKRHDVLLLSTDGLHKTIEHEQLKRNLIDALRDGEDPAQRLMDLAQAASARDNITALVVQCFG